jgi:hypothetical protein
MSNVIDFTSALAKSKTHTTAIDEQYLELERQAAMLSERQAEKIRLQNELIEKLRNMK